MKQTVNIHDFQNAFYIEYLNKANNFREERKKFTGKNAEEKAVKWGKKNLDNFTEEMVRIER